MKKQSNNRNKKHCSTSLASPRPHGGKGKVRIVGGQLKRSVLVVNDADGLRPTPERVRETVFDWLSHFWGDLTDKTVCDLFAGSGALGFESLSRGAKHVVWTDANAANVRAIKESLSRFSVQGTFEAKKTDAFEYLKSTALKFDLIFIDPPFERQWQSKSLQAGLKTLAQDGILYVESPEVGIEPELLQSLRLVKIRSLKAGKVYSELLVREESQLSGFAKLSKSEKAEQAKKAQSTQELSSADELTQK